MLQSFITKMFNEGFSRNTISSIRGIITKAFDYAVDNHYIITSPAVKLTTPKNLQLRTTTRHKPHIYISQKIK